MSKRSLDEILSGFRASDPAKRSRIKDGAPISVWLVPEYKEKYDSIQEKSGGKFCKTLRELVMAAIDSVES